MHNKKDKFLVKLPALRIYGIYDCIRHNWKRLRNVRLENTFKSTLYHLGVIRSIAELELELPTTF